MRHIGAKKMAYKLETVDVFVRTQVTDAATDVYLHACSTRGVQFLGEITEGNLEDMTRIISEHACERVFIMADDIGLFLVTLG